ncbi:hypothetical protein LTS14_002458 [Recurvomyces mirabilis]|uniref:uncharacterized protein n=1 Tax=Recurvomyces mirabilis TaxID=574656 RepID=UPI002DE15892|nr:hypothetical protein LTS14_002458 [Recurvomyces mirabilis]
MRLFASLLGSGLLIAGTVLQVQGQVAPPIASESGVSAFPFDLSNVQLTGGRFADFQNRTLSYIKTVSVDRLLYVFRSNHKLSTNGAQANSGWDAPSFPFRSHFQGHILSAWAQCYATLRDGTCKSQAVAMTAAMVQCQANNGAAGFATGYLAGFPESDFTALEGGKLTNGNVPWYVIHKILAGLLDVWRNIGDNNAKTATMALAEFGGMAEVLSDIYYQTGDKKWLTTAARFDHQAIMTPLANNQDQLSGLHANTNVPKWIAAAREYKATGTSKYLDVARNAWNIVIKAHTYAPGGNSQAEHFRAANDISGYLTTDTMEHCNSYNMLKLTHELWAIDPTNVAYFDFYERTLLNHILGAHDQSSSHGAVSYFSSLNPGATRGLGPAWGSGTWATDYSSFWCCQGTSVEVHTKHMDSIYFRDSSSSTLYVNLFVSSVLNWASKSIKITQSTTFPTSDTTTLTVAGTGQFTMKIRVPSWAKSTTIKVNGAAITAPSAGSYASINRSWASGDVVTAQFTMGFGTAPANDKSSLAAITYGPLVLSGLSSATTAPTLQLNTLKRTSTSALTFSATAGGSTMNLEQFADAQHVRIVTYFTITGSLP